MKELNQKETIQYVTDVKDFFMRSEFKFQMKTKIFIVKIAKEENKGEN